MKGTIWCLHGAVGMAEDWRGLSVPGWSVKRVDLWRFLDCCPMSMAEFGAALNREVEATQGPNVLLGYSMGGRLGLHALLEEVLTERGLPQRDAPATDWSETLQPRRRWDAAVIVSAHPGLEDEKEERRAKDAEWGTRALNGDWKEFLEAWNAQSVLGTPLRPSGYEGQAFSIEGRRSLEQRRQAVARSFMDWSLGGQESLWDRIPEIDCPLLWVVGEKDGKFRALGERLARLESRAPLLWVAEGAGHRVPWEAAEEFANKLGEFLEHAVS